MHSFYHTFTPEPTVVYKLGAGIYNTTASAFVYRYSSFILSFCMFLPKLPYRLKTDEPDDSNQNNLFLLVPCLGMARDLDHQDAASATSTSEGVQTNAKASAQRPTLEVEVEREAQLEHEYVYDRDYRFWSIIVALCTMQVLCSLENTVVVTSLPTIVKQLGLGSSYIWVTNIFFLAT